MHYPRWECDDHGGWGYDVSGRDGVEGNGVTLPVHGGNRWLSNSSRDTFFRLRKSKSMDGGQIDTEQKEVRQTTIDNEEDKGTEVSGEIVNNVEAVKDVAKELEEVEEAVGDVEEFCEDNEEDLEEDREEEDDKENDVRAAVLRRGAISAEHIGEPDEENSHEKVFFDIILLSFHSSHGHVKD